MSKNHLRLNIHPTAQPQSTILSSPTMASGGAYGANRASDTDFRKKWDKEEFSEKAKAKDQEERERLQENEERLKQGTPLLPLPRATP